MEFVPDQSDSVLTLSFTDESGNGVTPADAYYRIDVAGGNAITGNANNSWVQISVANNANTYDLAISANQNKMANNSTDREERIVTTIFRYSANNKQASNEYRYMIWRPPYLLNVPS